MSVRIPRSQLSEVQQQAIRTSLCFLPKVSFYEANRFSSERKSVIFYQVDQNDIILPYMFAKGLLERSPSDERIYPTDSFNFTGTLRDYQRPVADEALQQLLTLGTTLLGVYPGFGKTIVSAYLAAQFGLLTLVLYNRTVIETQWSSTFTQFTNAGIWVIGHPPPEKINVILCMDAQFNKLPLPYRQQIGFLIIDEGHLFCTPSHIDCLLGTEPKYIVVATATPTRDDGMEVMLQAMIGLHGVFRASQKYHQVYRFITGIKPVIQQNRHGDLDWSALVTDLCNDPIRNGYILALVKTYPDYKIGILTWRKEHAFHLHEWLSSMGESVAVMAGNRKNYSDSRVLVGTISKIGTGFDEQSACSDFAGERINLLIMVGTTKSDKVIEQTLGRAFRSDLPNIIVFTDEVASIKKHWSIMKHWCLNHNGEVYEVYAPNQQPQPQAKICNLAATQLAMLTQH